MYMSCLEIIIVTGATECWVEMHTATNEDKGEPGEWGAGRMGRKARWEVDKWREASELVPSNMDTTAEAIEPGKEPEWGTHNLTARIRKTLSMGFAPPHHALLGTPHSRNIR